MVENLKFPLFLHKKHYLKLDHKNTYNLNNIYSEFFL